MDDCFPVTYSILSVKALAVEVLPDYNMGEIAECKLAFVGVNDTYLVKTGRGETYYLRVYRSGWRSRSDVAYELDALDHLRRKGFPAAWPVPRKDGSFIHELIAPEGIRYAVLFVAAPGVETVRLQT